MEFLIQKFLDNLENNYQIPFVSRVNNDGTISIFMCDIPIEADIEMVNYKFDRCIKRVDIQNGFIKYKKNIFKTFPLCDYITKINNHRVLGIILTKEDYAIKINRIDFILSKYINRDCYLV